MKLHGNAALSLNGRRRMVLSVIEHQIAVADAARAAGVSQRTCSKWVARYRAEGEAGLLDHSSAPHHVHNRMSETTIQLLAALRRLRLTAPELADLLDMPISTISGILKRIGMGKLGRLGQEPAVRYERQRPGELIHIDIKKLGRIQGGAGKRVTGVKRNPKNARVDAQGIERRQTGWEYVHIAIDDATRLAYVEVLSDQKAITAVGFLHRVIAHYNSYGIEVEQLITDNGPAYRSAIHHIACRALGIKHIHTKPYRPQTNGKAERFIRTMLAGWAYGAIYRNSNERTAALDGWLYHYNHHRRHSAIGRQPPISRLNNLLGTYT
jgi:transposase InsO family protein